MSKRLLIESILFALLLMSLIIGWQVVQGYLSTQALSNEFSSELSNEISVDTALPIHNNGTVHIAYWSSPSVLFGADQPIELVGIFLLFAALYYFIRKYVSKHKTSRNK